MIACRTAPHASEALHPPAVKHFTFTATPLPLSAPLTFTAALLSPFKLSCKRARPAQDVDGDAFLPRKKRRIRFSLVTSRLSQPYAVPTTHIIDRGSNKIAVWCRQKGIGSNNLCKAAILNLARMNRHRNGGSKSPSPPPALKPDPLPQVAGEENEMRAPPKPFVPLPPSPLGLSNYDALDDYPMDGDDGDDENGDTNYYSDFNVMEADDDDTNMVAPKIQETEPIVMHKEVELNKKLPSPPDEMMIEMLLEEERKKEATCFDSFFDSPTIVA